MTRLDTLKADMADQAYTVNYEQARQPGTLAYVAAAVLADDATDEEASEAVAEFLHRHRDHILWPRSARWGLLLDYMANDPAFEKDRHNWRNRYGEDVADYAVYYRCWQQMRQALVWTTPDPELAVMNVLEAGGYDPEEYDVAALAKAIYTYEPGCEMKKASARLRDLPALFGQHRVVAA